MRTLVPMTNLLALLTIAVSFVACADKDHAPAQAPEQAASEIHPRYVSILPNATEILFALGAGDNVVGATRYCDRPKEALKVPRVGGMLDVSVEAVLAQKPDVVIGSPTVLAGRLAKLLSASGTKLVPLYFETIDDLKRGIHEIGQAISKEKEASDMLATLEKDLKTLDGRAKLLEGNPIKVLMIVGRSPLVVAGKTSFLGSLMDMMGVQNVVDADKLTFPTWSFEQVLQSAPDVVINGMVGASDLQSVLAGAGVEAAKSGRYVSEVNLAILRPGPETVLGAIELADAIKSVYQANPPTKEVAE